MYRSNLLIVVFISTIISTSVVFHTVTTVTVCCSYRFGVGVVVGVVVVIIVVVLSLNTTEQEEQTGNLYGIEAGNENEDSCYVFNHIIGHISTGLNYKR